MTKRSIHQEPKTSIANSMLGISASGPQGKPLPVDPIATETLLEKISAAIVVHRRDTTILMCNRVARLLLGMTEAQLIGKSAFDNTWTFFDDSGKRLSPENYPVNRVIETGRPLRNMIAGIYRRATQDMVWVYVTAEPHVDDNARVSHVIVTFIDITELKKAQESLAKSEEKYRKLFNNLQEGIWGTNKNDITIFVNPRMAQMLGYTPEEMRGKHLFEFIDDAHLEAVKANLKRRREGKREQHEFTFSKKDGTYLHALIETFPQFDENRNYKGAVASVMDISDRKKAEEEKKLKEAQLRQAHKMEAIGTLSGGIAHEFNNILGIILGNTELSLDDVPEWNPAHPNLHEIKSACLRAKKIIDQLLTFSKKTDAAPRIVQLSAVLNNSTGFLRSIIPKNINLHYENRATHDTIIANPSLIEQVMINLCTNASQAMERTGGNLTIRVENEELNGRSSRKNFELKRGRYIKICVDDTGPGIDPGIIDRVFDPYFTTREVGKGAGMGLAVVHGIIKNHNGIVNLESTPGKGATFTVYLPLLQSSADAEGDSPPTEPPKGTEAILFVDDETSIAKMVSRMLERLGYRVKTAISAREALAHFRKAPDHFDLIITDMTMPEMTGLELFRKIKEIREDIPVILATGHSTLIDDDTVKEMGVAQLIMKPIGRHDLARAIREVLNHPGLTST